jgi:hypothetical protein
MKKNNKNQNKIFLNKDEIMSKKKKEKIKPTQEIDMIKFKQKINQQIENNQSSCIEDFIDINQNDRNYLSLYRKYINEEFSPLCIVFINRIINQSETLTSEIKNNNDLHKILLSLTKQLMMNEYELTIYSMILDEFGWSNIEFTEEEYLMFIGFFVKHLCGDDELIILENIRQNGSLILIDEKYSNWKKLYNDKMKSHRIFTYNEVNKRYKLLKRPFNIYCKNNYIDYNNVVEKILKMSLPYNESKQKEEEDIISIDENEKKNKNNKLKKINFKVKNFSKIKDKTISTSNHSLESKNLGKKTKLKLIENDENYDKNVKLIIPIKEDEKILNLNNFKSQNINNNNNMNMMNPYFQGFHNFYSAPYEKKNDFSYNYLIPQNNQSQHSLNSNIQIKNPSLIDVNNLTRKSLQTLENDEDNLRNLLNSSNNNFFQSGFSLNNVYDSNLEPFNLGSASMYSNKFENYSEMKLNENNNLQVPIRQNSHFSLDNVYRNNSNKVFGILNNNFAINYNNNQFSPVFQNPVNRNNLSLNNINNTIQDNQNQINQIPSFTGKDGNKDKKNLLGLYNQLKQKQINKN